MLAGWSRSLSLVRSATALAAAALALGAAVLPGCSSGEKAQPGEQNEPAIAAAEPEPIEIEDAEQRVDADSDPLDTEDTEAAAPHAGEPKRIDRVTLGGGLVIEDLMLGHGPLLASSEGVTVTVHYRGLVKGPAGEAGGGADAAGGQGELGRVFDSTYERGEPATMELDRLIRGWRQGLPGMRVGGMRRLTIPPDLAYGDAGYLDVPGGATVMYEVLLLGFSPIKN